MSAIFTLARKPNRPQAALDWLKKSGVSASAINKLEVLSAADGSAEINITGSIGKSWWDDSGISYDEFKAACDEIPANKPLTIRINSEGGSVQDGLGIYNTIKTRAGKTTCVIVGYAISIASVIPLAASKVVSPKSSIWMIHNAWAGASGDNEEMMKVARMLEAHNETLIDIYQEATGKPKEEIRAAMKAETWIKGADAVAWGLADETDNDDGAQNSLAGANTATQNQKAEPVSTLTMGALAANKSPEPITAPQTLSPASQTPPENKNNTQPNQPMPEINTPAAAQPVAPVAAAPAAQQNPVTREEFDNMVKAMNKQRVEEKVLAFVTKGVITNEEAPIFIGAALQNEAATLEVLNKKTPVLDGSIIGTSYELGVPSNAPASEGVMQFAPVAQIVTKHGDNKEAAFREVLANWEPLFKRACAQDAKQGRQVMNANSISGFLTSFLLSGSLTPLQNKWAPLSAICRDYSTDPYKPLATATLKNPTAAASTLTDATSFNSGNSTVGALTATMHQYTQPFQISNTDLNSGLRMEDLVTINQAAFADKVISVALAPVTAANFNQNSDAIVSSAAAFGFNELAALQGLIQKANKKNLILDGTYIARVANTPGFFQQTGTVNGNPGAWSAFGWDGIYLNSNWTGAGANIKGIALDPQAIFGIMGLPLTPVTAGAGGIFSVNTVTIPGVNVSVAVYTWWDVNTRTLWTSYDIVAGFGLGDATAGKLVASGTPG